MADRAEGTMRLLVVEDDSRFGSMLVDALDEGPGLKVSALSGSVKDAIERMRSPLQFDVALIDLGLPDGSGVDVVAAMRRLRPGAVPLVFTVFDDAPTVFLAIRAGARGYLLKSTPRERLVELIREAHDGGAPMTPSIARLVVETLAQGSSPAEQPLTPREQEVLVLLAKGVSYQGIAEVLGIGLGTVQGHVKRIYEKLEITSKAEAATLAAKWGLV